MGSIGHLSFITCTSMCFKLNKTQLCCSFSSFFFAKTSLSSAVCFRFDSIESEGKSLGLRVGEDLADVLSKLEGLCKYDFNVVPQAKVIFIIL